MADHDLRASGNAVYGAAIYGAEAYGGGIQSLTEVTTNIIVERPPIGQDVKFTLYVDVASNTCFVDSFDRSYVVNVESQNNTRIAA
jgi:hypothetical protein